MVNICLRTTRGRRDDPAFCKSAQPSSHHSPGARNTGVTIETDGSSPSWTYFNLNFGKLASMDKM